MRLFIAIDVNDEHIKERIIKKQRDILNNFNIKPIRPDQLHFTLMFLGEVSNVMLESIKSKLSEIRFEPMNVRYKYVGAFPTPKRARVIWIGVDEDSAKRLGRLAKSIESKLSSLGFKSDKEFGAHITILRAKNIVNCSNIISDEEFGEEVLDKVKLKESVLTNSGPLYSDLFIVDALGD